jgi:hypothetical protein
MQNVRAITPKDDWISWKHYCQRLRDSQVDIVGMTETNMNWTTERIHEAAGIQRNCRHGERTPVFFTAITSDEPCNHNYLQHGGTAIAVMGCHTGRVTGTSNDKSGLGRFTSIQLRGKHNKCITIISAYRVCQKSPSEAGISSAYMQQWRILRKQEPDCTPDIRQQCLDDLHQLITRQREEGNEIILLIDANECSADNKQFQTFLQSTGLIDLVALKHGEQSPPTYHRGSKTIDYILGTPATADCVTKCGFDSFDESIFDNSDHRGIYIDLDTNHLFNDQDTLPPRTAQRILASNRPKQTKKFTEILYRECRKHNLHEELANILANDDLDDATKNKIERLDQTMTQAMLHAETKSANNHEQPWTLEVHKRYEILRYWRAALRQAKHKAAQHNQSDNMTSIATAFGDDIYQNQKTARITKQIRTAIQKLREARLNADDARRNYLANNIEITLQATTTEKRRARILRSILKSEERQQCFDKMRRALRPTSTSGLQHIEIPDDALSTANNPIWKTISDRACLEDTINRRNEQHFAQAHGTPFTVPPFQPQMTYGGDSPTGRQILRGDIRLPDDTPEITRAFIAEMKHTGNKEINKYMSLQDTKQGFKQWKEATSTSPSGLHLGMYRALTTRAAAIEIPAHEQEQSAPNTMGDYILNIRTMIINIAIKFNHSYDRWHTVHSTMIEKEPGNPKLNRLRVIHLFEADWNLMLKCIIARRLMHSIEAHGTMAKEQWGGRRGRSSIDLAASKILASEINRLNRTDGSTFESDLAQCFDRIAAPCGNLALRQQGLPEEIAALWSNTRQQQRHHTKTGKGVSDDFHVHTDQTPLHGTGQGAGDSGCRWNVITSIVISAYNKRMAQTSVITDPTLNITVARGISAFIDDATLYTNYAQPTKYDKMLSDTQRNGQLWEQLVHISGGKLNIDKCSICIFEWTFDAEGKASLQAHDNTRAALTSSADHTESVIATAATSAAYKSLGIRMAADGNWKEEVQQLKRKNNKFANALAKCTLNRTQALTAYRSIYIPSTTYSLAATSISPTKLLETQSAATRTVLSKTGFNQLMPRAVVFGPGKLGGIGMINMASEQDIQHITFYVRHIRAQTETGKLCEILTRTAQLIAGRKSHILADPTEISYLPAGWMKTTLTALRNTNAVIETYRAWTLPTLREGDQHIMDAVCHATDRHGDKPTTRDLEQFNRCRLYLQVTSVAEIATSDGTAVQQHIMETRPYNAHGPILWMHSTSTLHWPRQEAPGPRAWRAWRTWLKHSLLEGKYQLRTKLYKWLPTVDAYPRHWHAHCDNQYVYKRTNAGTWATHPITSQRRTGTSVQSTATGIMDKLPPNAVPTIINATRSVEWRTDSTSRGRTTPTQTPTQNADADWSAISPINTHPANYLIQPARAIDIVVAGTTDKNTRRTTASWTIINDGTAQPIQEADVEDEEDGTLHRGETAAIMAAIAQTMHHGADTAIATYTGCRHLTTELPWYQQQQLSSRHTTGRDSDIRLTIGAMMRQSQARITFHHITKEEDPHLPDGIRATYVRVLTRAIKRAARTTTTEAETVLPTTPNAGNRAQLRIDGRLCTNNIAKNLRHRATAPAYNVYLQTRFHWTADTLKHVHWPGFTKALNSLNDNRQRRTRKMIHEWLPVNATLHRYNSTHPTRCPTCNNDEETQQHWLTCDADSRNQIRHDHIELIQHYLETTKTSAHVQRAISQLLGNNEHETNALARAQLNLGTPQIYYGRLHRDIAHAHQLHTNCTRTQCTAWVAGLIGKIWDLTEELWKSRNQDQHGRPGQENTLHKQEKTRNKIRELYANKPRLLNQDQAIFQLEEEAMLEQPLHLQQHWIKHAETFIKGQLQAAITHTQQTTRNILEYFRR